MLNQSKHPRGFTLVELMCVVVIMGIASVLIIPQLGTSADLKTAAAARTVMADLAYAQNRAISTQSEQYVVFDLATQTYTLKEGSPLTTIMHPVTLKSYVQTFGSTGLSSVVLTSATFDTKTVIAFDELGAPYSYDSLSGTAALTSGEIKLTSGDFTMTLTVEPYTGEITVVTP